MDPFRGHVRGSEDRVSLGYVGDPVCRDAQIETISHFFVAGSCKVVFWSWLFLSVQCTYGSVEIFANVYTGCRTRWHMNKNPEPCHIVHTKNPA